MDSEVEDLLEKTETISRVEFRKQTQRGGRSSKYEKYQDLAQELEKGGPAKVIPEITENQVSGIRTQIEGLNPDDATKKEEKEFIATRRKIDEEDERDTFNEDGKQLYNLYIARREPKEEPSGGEDTTSQETSEDSESSQDEDKRQNEERSEAREDFEGMFDDT